jgi:EAL domain-containing protein (putative c-di-GMP-specific phosphodiesterase class I)
MGKKTIAEFVTDEETIRLLEKAGVDYAQGYHVGKPRPLDDLVTGTGGAGARGDPIRSGDGSPQR